MNHRNIDFSRIRVQAVLLFFFTFLIYSNTLFFDYALDDGLMIKHNHLTKMGLKGIPEIMVSDQFAGITGQRHSELYTGGRYRPLSQIIFAVSYAFFGLNPFAGHLFNVLLYAFLSVVLLLVMNKLFPQKKTSWFLSMPFLVTVLYIAHPIHTEVVANIKSLDELSAMFLSLLVLYWSLQYVDTGNKTYLLWSFVAFIAALLAKESAAPFFAVVPLTLFVFRRLRFKDYVVVMTPLMLAVMAYATWRFHIFGFDYNQEKVKSTLLFHNPFMYATPSQHWATVFYTWLKYFILFVFPHPLTHDYYPKQIPIIGWTDVRTWLAVLLYLFALLYSLIRIWKRDVVAYGILYFFLTFSVVANVFFDLGLFMNERLVFISSLGFVIVLAYVLHALLPRIIRSKEAYKQVATALLIMLVTGYSVKTFSRNFAWKDGETLYLTDVKVSVNSGRCNVNTGAILLDRYRKAKNEEKDKALLEQAAYYLQRGLRIYADNIGGWGALGEVYVYQKKYKQAENAFLQVLRLKRNSAQAKNNLSVVSANYRKQGQYADALRVDRLLISLDSNAVPFYLSLAEDYALQGHINSAINTVLHAAGKKAGCYECYNRVAEYYGKYLHRLDQSLDFLKKAYQINPRDESVLENMGIVYGMMHDFTKSLFYFREAEKIAPDRVSLLANISKTYSLMGNGKQARLYAVKMQQLKQRK